MPDWRSTLLDQAEDNREQTCKTTLPGYLVSKRLRTAASLTPSTLQVLADTTVVDWSQFAYIQYVTNLAYLCNSVMIFESISRFGSHADKLMMYPHEWSLSSDDNSDESRLLRKARDKYHVRLVPITVQRSSGQDATWMDSFTKLLAFNQTQYERVIILDSDATLLQNMDELFFLPPAPIAIPRAYWLDPKEHVLTSLLDVITPSAFEFDRIQRQIANHSANEFDMEIINNLYGDNCLVIPHRPYGLLSGEFRASNHHAYLGSDEETWDPVKVWREAKLIHFSDWPYPKPWIKASDQATEERKPACHKNETGGVKDCRGQEIWLELYKDFSRRREAVCGHAYG
ncbi:glycosyltransferase family 8 protein [Aplosporella prunicola CBS 121167]|uniref:Glycosyltransferase family 8 protein n=1 Tax=Aplosporella prunicola CBS 121167 TaxID=1176127 RepID=A0A6A6BLG1_9PEZI|nr:glycosyltransferase family 8 protein [Aplosporella prunicola CBS 121167]KAF2144950.1 glycosyltransferase family 8 protein [Aplosporella prunicola CBS 121167]